MKTRSLHFDRHPWWKSRDSILDAFVSWGKTFSTKQKLLDAFLLNDFIFSPGYRVARHGLYWAFNITIWSVFWLIMDSSSLSFWRYMFNMALWVPGFILFGYPLAYWAVPQLLFKSKVVQFFLIVLAWGGLWVFLNGYYRTYIYIPIQEAIGFEFLPAKGFKADNYLCMTTSASGPMIVKFFKLWTSKQRDWMATQQEKITAELQLLKAQVHPHFLFNTLNNIYAISVEHSPKTPGLILKLSSLLSYMLYDCNEEQVRLEKEVEIMKNYIDLERDRIGSKVDVSWNVEGNTSGMFISPLLILPFLENAFKHGVADDVQQPWLSVDISVNSGLLRCKIANSKNELVSYDNDLYGADVLNVKRRLALMYPDGHEFKMYDEGQFFVVSLLIKLNGFKKISTLSPLPSLSK